MNFEQASERVNQLSELPDNATLLKLYSLYKQGSTGDVTGKRPGMINLRERAKWDAWKALAGMDSKTAQTQYIKLVEELLKKDQRKR
jgi:acyl-CoA-binding protein